MALKRPGGTQSGTAIDTAGDVPDRPVNAVLLPSLPSSTLDTSAHLRTGRLTRCANRTSSSGSAGPDASHFLPGARYHQANPRLPEITVAPRPGRRRAGQASPHG